MKVSNIELDVYNNSKTSDCKTITGDFEILDIVRNGRTKVISLGDEKEYWTVIPSDFKKETSPFENITLVNNISEEMITEETEITEKDSFKLYKVSRGDTLSRIATKFNVTESAIVSANGGDTFAIGQVIRIPTLEV